MPSLMKTHSFKALQPKGRTLKHRQQETGRTLALNGAAWRKLRHMVLTEQPLCPHCAALGHAVLAKEVDHIDNDPRNNLRSNLVGLCKVHHGQKTRRAELEKSPATKATRTAPQANAHRRIC